MEARVPEYVQKSAPESAHAEPPLPLPDRERLRDVPEPPEPEEQTLDLGALWLRVRRRGRRIAAITAASTALAILAALLLPSWYRATASLLPPSDEDSAFGLSSLLKGVGVPGIKVPTQSEPADVFVAILKSRRINEDVVRRFDLRTRYKKKFLDDVLHELATHTRFSVNDAGIIVIEAEDRDPKRAAELANGYVDALDRFNREVRMTKGRRTREFVGERLQSTEKQL